MVGWLALNLGLPLALGLGGAFALFIAATLWLAVPGIRRLE
jgi:hypothetical protein